MNRIKTSWQSIHPTGTVVAVTKTFPFEAIATAYMMGARHIGENRVEEARGKREEANRQGYQGLIWHMIGHVQSRKIPEVVKLFDWVDSVDSIELLKKLNAAATVQNKKLHILFEINLSGEESKYGFDLVDWETTPEKLQRVATVTQESSEFKNIIPEGLMTMAPYVEDPEKNRPIFRSMKQLLEKIRTQIPAFGSVLSMGTSCDYEVAIEEGATQVRLGTALFGPRG